VTNEPYTHGHHESVLRSHTSRTAENSAGYLLDRLRPGVDVLDVGCGPGTITADFATRVAPGRVIAIDNAPEILDVARDTARERGVENATFAVGDVYQLDLPDGSFDVVHAHQLLQHLTDPVSALREMRRVCKPGGVVAARDSDYAAMTWHPPSAALDRWLELYHDITRANGAEADAGRHLLEWAHGAGFTEVRASASAWCFATPAERDWWGGLWADRITSSRFAEQAVARRLSGREELAQLAEGFRTWARDDNAWFAVLHGEILCTP
jgi:ubiquinone/menaquinone biosynthesis C-methylase UbiE